jgi:hypothetical protein
MFGQSNCFIDGNPSMKMIKLLCFFSSFVFSQLTFAKVDYSKKWFTKDSKNFSLIHNAKQEELATYILQEAERSHNILKKYFATFPDKTLIVLDDSIDMANGSATIFPYPIIRLHTAIPEFDTSITDYGNWYYELILHEYVHILNTYPANGIFHIASLVFGNIGRPNQLLPRWQLEGLAVAIESLESHHGRLRSPQFSAYARVLSKEQEWGRFKNLVEISETQTPSYPYGMRPYFFGAIYWEHLLKNFKAEDLKNFNERLGGRIPYFHNGGTENVYGKSESSFYLTAIEELKQKSLQQIEDLKDSSFPEKNLILNDYTVKLVRANKADEIALVRKKLNSSWELYLVNANKVLLSSDNFRSLCWHPTKNKLLYSKQNTQNNYNIVFDLYEFDIDNNKERQVSKNMHLKEACYSTDTKNIFAVESFNGVESILSGMEKNNSFTWTKIVSAPLGFRISKLQSLSENEIAYISKGTHGRSELKIRDLTTNSTRSPLGFLESFRDFRIHGDKIFFISAHTKVPQAYVTEAPYTSFYKIQNSLSMFQEIDYFAEKDMLLLTELGIDGFQLFTSSFEKQQPTEKTLAPLFPLKRNATSSILKDDKDISVEAPNENRLLEKTTPSKQSSHFQSKDYSSLQKMIPNYWFPWIYPYGEGTLFQLNTGATDPLGINSYSVSLGYDSFTKKGSHSLSYINRALKPDILFSYTNSYQYLQSAGQNIKRVYRRLGLIDYLSASSNDWRYSLYLNSDYNESAKDKTAGNLQAYLSYSNINAQRGTEVSPSGGYAYKLGLSLFPELTETESFQILHGEASKYFSSFLPERHSLKVSAKYDKRSSNTTDIYAALVSGGGDSGGIGTRLFHLNRGYPFSQFLAWSMLSINTEYNLPLFDIYQALGNIPVFSRQIFGRLVFDISMMDGYYYSKDDSAYLRDRWSSSFISLGGELVWDTTVGYHLPMKFELGIYQGLKKRSGGDTRLSLRFSLPIF